jgi:hypothetical protein
MYARRLKRGQGGGHALLTKRIRRRGFRLHGSKRWPRSRNTVAYTSDTAYFAVAGPQTVQDFASPISSVPGTSVTFPGLVVSCSGSLCAHDFGASGGSIFLTNFSVVTFTFASPIRSFGIYVAGNGHGGPGVPDDALDFELERILGGPVRELHQPG